MSDSEQCRPSANTRSNRSLGTFSLQDLTGFEFINEAILKSSNKGIPGPRFELARTPDNKKALTQRNRSNSISDLTTPDVIDKLLNNYSQETNAFKFLALDPFRTINSNLEDLFSDSDNPTPKNKNKKIKKVIKQKFETRKKIKFEMAELTYTDLITIIPIFEGQQEDLDYLISTCSTFDEIVAEEQKDMFVSIVKAKLKGIALTKMQPFSDLKKWDQIKTRLEEKFKRPITYETAQDEISNIRQNRTESIEIYGNNVRLALHKLNIASETLTTDVGSLRLLRTANEKIAVRKFEHGLYNDNLKICIGAKDYSSLDIAISYAMEKENLYKNESRIRCNYCNIVGHIEKECGQKQQNYNRSNDNNNDNRYKQLNSANENPNSDARSDFAIRNSNSGRYSNNFHVMNNSNRWKNDNHHSNPADNSDIFYPYLNSSNYRNAPQNVKELTGHTNDDEALNEDEKF